jgi:hypothetical protein
LIEEARQNANLTILLLIARQNEIEPIIGAEIDGISQTLAKTFANTV